MPISLIFDCGATNLRTVAIDSAGKLLAIHYLSNSTKAGKESPHYHIWDIDEIWSKLIFCAKQTLSKLSDVQIKDIVGISVTSFGVDGTLFDDKDRQLYPIISWKCPRTLSIMENISKLINIEKLYERNGVGHYSFNTLFKLIWLKQHYPELYRHSRSFLFISSILTYRLTGEKTTDRTMAGTSMMTNLVEDDWDSDVLTLLDLDKNFFPPIKNAGDKIGVIKSDIAQELGLSSTIPVISTGHDTQFAVLGSGADYNQPILSSGTWEILMARTQSVKPTWHYAQQGLTIELDSQIGSFNPGIQWVGSGVIEWIGKTFFTDVLNSDAYYSTMIKEGELVLPQVNGIKLQGKFDGTTFQTGSIVGLSMYSTRGEIYRAGLEYMAFRLKESLSLLEEVGQFKAQQLICVGGGSKNKLWNQIRADVLNLPIDIVDISETTVLGAAMFTFTGVGIFDDIQQAQRIMKPAIKRVVPSENSQIYQQIEMTRSLYI